MFVGISNNLSKFGTTDIPNEMHLVHARSYPWDKWQMVFRAQRRAIYWAEQARTPILIHARCRRYPRTTLASRWSCIVI